MKLFDGLACESRMVFASQNPILILFLPKHAATRSLLRKES
jgi:hypothetical protein